MAALQQACSMQVDHRLLAQAAAWVLVGGPARSARFFDSRPALAWSGLLIAAPVLNAIVARQDRCRLTRVGACADAGRHRGSAGYGERSAFTDGCALPRAQRTYASPDFRKREITGTGRAAPPWR